MSTRANYFKIGLFIIITVSILLAGVIGLSAGVLKGETMLFETYIDESVQGLSVGSPVMQRGVQIGKVKKISFVPYEYDMQYGSPEFDKYSKYVILLMEIDKSHFPDMPEESIRAIVRQWISNGLRLKLSYQGITGLAYVEADYVQAERFEPVDIAWEPKYIYIPSAPSTLTNLTQSIDSILQKLNAIDYEGITSSLETTLASIRKVIDDADVPQIRETLTGLMEDVRKTNSLVLDLMDKSRGNQGAANIPETIVQFNSTLKRMDNFIAGQQGDFEEIVSNLRRASVNIRALSEDLRKYPKQLLFGAQPPSSEAEE